MLKLVFCLAALAGAFQARQITVINSCVGDIWVSPLTNDPTEPELPPGIVQLSPGAQFGYDIPDSGWQGRLWPKTGCDGDGQNCEVGQSMPPCGPGGCDPPAETKVEFYFPPVTSGIDAWYDISLIDGYSSSVEIVPSFQGGSCVTTHCGVSLDRCPTDDIDIGDLRMTKNGLVVACLAPCKRWSFPPPYGLGNNVTDEPGLHYCCPTPPVFPAECQTGPVIYTQYVNLIHIDCPTASGYAYDDEAGFHNCPNNVDFNVTFCA